MSEQSSPAAASKRRPPLATLPNAASGTGTTRRSSLARPVDHSLNEDGDGRSPKPKKARRSASKRVSFGGEQIKLFNNDHRPDWDDSPPALTTTYLNSPVRCSPRKCSPSVSSPSSSPFPHRPIDAEAIDESAELSSSLPLADVGIRHLMSASPDKAPFAAYFLADRIPCTNAPPRISSVFSQDNTVGISDIFPPEASVKSTGPSHFSSPDSSHRESGRPDVASSRQESLCIDGSASLSRRESVMSNQSNISDGDITQQVFHDHDGLRRLIDSDEPGVESSRPIPDSPTLSAKEDEVFASIDEVEMSMDDGEMTQPEITLSMNPLLELVHCDEPIEEAVPAVKPAPVEAVVKRQMLPESRQLFGPDHTGDDTTIHYHDTTSGAADKTSVLRFPAEHRSTSKSFDTGNQICRDSGVAGNHSEQIAIDAPPSQAEVTGRDTSAVISAAVPVSSEPSVVDSSRNEPSKSMGASVIDSSRNEPSKSTGGLKEESGGNPLTQEEKELMSAFDVKDVHSTTALKSAAESLVGVPEPAEVYTGMFSQEADNAFEHESSNTGNDGAQKELVWTALAEPEAFPDGTEDEKQHGNFSALKSFLEAVNYTEPHVPKMTPVTRRSIGVALSGGESSVDDSERQQSSAARQSRIFKDTYAGAREEVAVKLMENAKNDYSALLDASRKQIAAYEAILEDKPPAFFQTSGMNKTELKKLELDNKRLMKASKVKAQWNHHELRCEREKTIAAAQSRQVTALRKDLDLILADSDFNATESINVDSSIAEADISSYISRLTVLDIEPASVAILRSQISSHVKSLKENGEARYTGGNNKKAMVDELSALRKANASIEADIVAVRDYARASSKTDLLKLVNQRRDEHRHLSLAIGIYPRILTDSEVQVRLLGVSDLSFALTGNAVTAVKCDIVYDRLDMSTEFGNFVKCALDLLSSQCLTRVNAVRDIPGALQHASSFMTQVLKTENVMVKYNSLREASYDNFGLPASSLPAAEVNVLSEYYSAADRCQFDVKMTLIAIPPTWKAENTTAGSLNVRIDSVVPNIGKHPSVETVSETIVPMRHLRSHHPLEDALQLVWTLLR